MTRFLECLLAAVLVMAYVGCEPNTVVVPDGDDGTTIIEDDADADVDVVPVPDGTTTDSTGIDVNIGGSQQADPGASGTNTSGTNTSGESGTN